MKKLFVFLLAVISAAVLPLSVYASVPAVSAQHAVLYEASTGTLLYNKQGDERAPMASTTKIMTALIALESGDLDRQVVIPDEACGIEGSSIYMTPGEVLTLRQLLYALLLQSANDAAVAIAIEVSGSIEEFAAAMNEKASALGLQNTHFENPHGLDAKEHYTTAHDLACIAACALDNPVFKEIVSTVKYTIPHGTGGDVRMLVNHNKLLRMYPDAVGVKTGFTKKSGRCLVGAAERDGIMLISVTLDAPNDWNDHIRMFDYGFEQMKSICLCNAGEFVYELPVLGNETLRARCINRDAVYAVLPKDAESPEVEIDLPHYMTRSCKSGRTVGCIRFKHHGEVIAEGTLIFSEYIK